jgi:hypothetical protein
MIRKQKKYDDPRDANGFYKRLDRPVKAAELFESLLFMIVMSAICIILWFAFA